jgi:phytoene dehydrogenase-like protein
MGALVNELQRVAALHGVDVRQRAQVVALDSSATGVKVETADGEIFTADDLLFAAAPQLLAKLQDRQPQPSVEGAQLKINMLLHRLPRLKSGIDPRIAFAGTFHVNERYSQLEGAYAAACQGIMPQPMPLELYCHTLTDPSILSPQLIEQGYQTLTLFALHTPASLFDADPAGMKALALERALASLNECLLDPIESVLAPCSDGSLAIEIKTPLDLEKDVFLPRGNIFHRDLDFPFCESSPAMDGSARWGGETDEAHIFLAGAGALRGGGVSGIAGHNAAMAVLARG